MGRSSPISEKAYLELAKQFQNNVNGNKRFEDFNISSIAHDIIRRCRIMKGIVHTGFIAMFAHILQGRLCSFQQDNAKLHTASITKAWLCNTRVYCMC